MPKKGLTIKNKPPVEPLSKHVVVPFSITFRHKLQSGYRFTDLKPEHLKEWQRFLDKVSGQSFNEVDRLYRRKTDTTDVYNGEQIIHYQVSGIFRIHGIVQAGHFLVIRMDPEHKVHHCN